jgi:hypothetical protein
MRTVFGVLVAGLTAAVCSVAAGTAAGAERFSAVSCSSPSACMVVGERLDSSSGSQWARWPSGGTARGGRPSGCRRPLRSAAWAPCRVAPSVRVWRVATQTPEAGIIGLSVGTAGAGRFSTYRAAADCRTFRARPRPPAWRCGLAGSASPVLARMQLIDAPAIRESSSQRPPRATAGLG